MKYTVINEGRNNDNITLNKSLCLYYSPMNYLLYVLKIEYKNMYIDTHMM